MRRFAAPFPAAAASAPVAEGRRHARAVAALVFALAWLVVGCCGLLWTIAFTTDPRSMTIGLAVWVFCFVVPSTFATCVAYRLEEAEAQALPRRAPVHLAPGD